MFMVCAAVVTLGAFAIGAYFLDSQSGKVLFAYQGNHASTLYGTSAYM